MAEKGTAGNTGGTNENTSQTVGTAVIGDGQGPRRISFKSRWVQLCAVLVGLIVIGGLVYLATAKQSSNEPAQQPQTLEQQQQSELQKAQAATQSIGSLDTPAQREAAVKKYLDLGAAQLNNNDAKTAVSSFEFAASVSEEKRVAASGLMSAYEVLGQYDKAAEQCDQFIGYLQDRVKADPTDITSQQRLASYPAHCSQLREQAKQ